MSLLGEEEEKKQNNMYLKKHTFPPTERAFLPTDKLWVPHTSSTWTLHYSIGADYCFAGTNKELQNTTGRRVFLGRNISPTL